VYAELNLVNRYVMDVAIRSSKIYRLAPVDEDDTDESDEHPLVPLGAVNSTLLRGVQVVRWPPQGLNNNNSARVVGPGLAHIKARYFSKILGQEVVGRNAGQRDVSWHGRQTDSPVHVGPWKFTTVPERFTKPRGPEAPLQIIQITPGTCHAYFAIRAKNIPTLTGTDDQPEDLIFGIIHHFIRLHTPFWLPEDRVHEIADCTCWRVDWTALGGLMQIKLGDYIKMKQGDSLVKLRYIPLRYIETQVMMAPVVKNWERAPGEGDPYASSELFYAIPLQV
jgi:hypothetical protein